MPEFLEILSLYYLCDATALVRPMSGAEVQDCMGIYDAVKAWFAPFDLAPEGTVARHGQLLEGYAGFLAWQDANAPIVAQLRADAMAQASGLVIR